MSTTFSQDLCGKNVEKNSVRIYADIMSTKFSKDLCGKIVDKIQSGKILKNVDKNQ